MKLTQKKKGQQQQQSNKKHINDFVSLLVSYNFSPPWNIKDFLI